MHEISVELTESEIETLSRCADRRDIDSVETYAETLLKQFVAYALSHEGDQEVDKEIKSKLETLGYL